MKLFKFEIEVYTEGKYDGKKFFETHYFNIEEISEIIVSKSFGNVFIVKKRDGGNFYVKNDYLDSLLKLVDIGEKETKK